MAVVTKEAILERVKTLAGENKDDNVISLLEDVTDTFTDLEQRSTGGGDNTDWKAKYEELDTSWRERYIARFENTDVVDTATHEQEIETASDETLTYESLFKEG